MGQKPETDQGLSDAELLAMPTENVSPAALTRVWELHARHTQEKAQEAVEMAVQHRQIEQQTANKREEERAAQEYQATMRAVQNRTERLLEDIDREERRLEKRREEIDARAIRLKDGRRVYVDVDGYRDGEGRALAGSERSEAEQKAQPNSARWVEKREADARFDALKSLKEKTERFQNSVSRETYGNKSDAESGREGKAAQQQLQGFEREFASQAEDRTAADTDYGAADYGALKSVSFAHTVAGEGDRTIRTAFAPAADQKPSDGLKTGPASLPAPTLS